MNRAGKRGGQAGPGDADLAGLQGLAQRVEHVAGELRRLVEEQAAVVGQRGGARAGSCRCRRRRSPPWWRCGAARRTAARSISGCAAAAGCRPPSGSAVTSRRRARSSRGRIVGQPLGQHGLAHARRARAAAGDGRPPRRSRPPAGPSAGRRRRPGRGARAAPAGRDIRRRSGAGRALGERRLGVRRPVPSTPRPRAAARPRSQASRRSGSARRAPRDARDQRGLGARSRRARRRAGTRPPRRRRGREHAAGPAAPGRPAPARRGRPSRPAAAGPRSAAARIATAMPRSKLLPRLGRLAGRQADRDPPVRPVLAAVDDGRPDPVPRLAQRGVRQSDQQQARPGRSRCRPRSRPGDPARRPGPSSAVRASGHLAHPAHVLDAELVGRGPEHPDDVDPDLVEGSGRARPPSGRPAAGAGRACAR